MRYGWWWRSANSSQLAGIWFLRASGGALELRWKRLHSLHLGRHDATSLERVVRVHARGTRVFTTECTENTEGMRRKQSFLKAVLFERPSKMIAFLRYPLCDLCALCGEYTPVMTQHELVTRCVRAEACLPCVYRDQKFARVIVTSVRSSADAECLVTRCVSAEACLSCVYRDQKFARVIVTSVRSSSMTPSSR
jgi:hypothetical protein